MRSILSVAVAGVFVALAVTACGGSDEPDTAADALSAQVQEVCDEWGRSFADRGEFPVDGFDPASPDPDDLPAVGEYFAGSVETQPEMIAALRELPVTGEQSEQLEALAAAWEDQYADAKAQVEAALASDVEAFVATLDGVDEANGAVEDAADALGVPVCGQS